MPAYHQMGHNSANLLGEVPGYRGAILSPVNESEANVIRIIQDHRSANFEFILDPQLYFPNRSDRGQLADWSYFPSDLDTADVSSEAWWQKIVDELLLVADRIGVQAVCSPAVVGRATFTPSYYEAMRRNADLLLAHRHDSIRVLQSVVVKASDLADPKRPFEIASIVSNTEASGIYLIVLSDVKPRNELRDEAQLTGVMRLISLLENAGLPVLFACSSSDLVLWKAAGATSCATGKFANLRRFTAGRFDDNEDGGRQMAYWFEEGLLAFIRGSDLHRVRDLGIIVPPNHFGQQILEQLERDPTRPWVGLGWRQYMEWFSDMESRLSVGDAVPRTLIRAAEDNWQLLEDNDVFMEERANDGGWLRPWLRALIDFGKEPKL